MGREQTALLPRLSAPLGSLRPGSTKNSKEGNGSAPPYIWMLSRSQTLRDERGAPGNRKDRASGCRLLGARLRRLVEGVQLRGPLPRTVKGISMWAGPSSCL